MRQIILALLLTGLGGLLADSLAAQERRPLDGITAGREAHQQAEARRQAAIGAQIQANQDAQYYGDLARWRNHTYYYGVPQTPYYSAPLVEDYRYRRTPYGGLYRRYSITSVPYGWPGNILGPTIIPPRYSDPIRQPIGQRQVQTGPNRWESYPIYDTDATISPDLPAAQPAPAPRIQVNEFRPEPAPQPAKPGSGPREF